MDCMRNAVLHRLAAAALAAMLLALAGLANAGPPSATLQVTAIVRHFFKLQVLSQPHSVPVTQRDIARGYVEVAMPVQLAVESNSREGYTIQFMRHGEAFQLAHVQGLGQELRVASEGAMNWQPAARRQTLEFRFRFNLAPQVAPGDYPWPIQVSMSPA
jgi:hypothetical protein